jgi:hypothetical protein
MAIAFQEIQRIWMALSLRAVRATAGVPTESATLGKYLKQRYLSRTVIGTISRFGRLQLALKGKANWIQSTY